MCALKSPMTQVLSNTSVKVFFGTAPNFLFIGRGGLQTPLPPLLSRLCPYNSLKYEFFSVLERQYVTSQIFFKLVRKLGSI